MVNTGSPLAGAVQPKPRYGHLTAIDPDYAPLKDAMDKIHETLWAPPLKEFLNAARSAPAVLLDDCPKVDEDITIEHRKVPVTDGTMIDICIYKPKPPVSDALLNLNAHGGGSYSINSYTINYRITHCIGWTVGGHTTEEGQDRLIASKNKAVVVSVDYRMAPEFKFPYAINDCFDVLKWVFHASPGNWVFLTMISQCKANYSILGINPETIVLSGGSAGGNLVCCPQSVLSKILTRS
jgi:acetyl esterase/lipase